MPEISVEPLFVIFPLSTKVPATVKSVPEPSAIVNVTALLTVNMPLPFTVVWSTDRATVRGSVVTATLCRTNIPSELIAVGISAASDQFMPLLTCHIAV